MGTVYQMGNLNQNAVILTCYGDTVQSYDGSNGFRRYYNWATITNQSGFTVPSGSGSTVDHFHVPKNGYYFCSFDSGTNSASNTMAWWEVDGGSVDATASITTDVHYGQTQSSASRCISIAIIYLTTTNELRSWVYSIGNIPKNTEARSRPDLQIMYMGE